MFDFIRQHNKLMMGLLFLLVIPSFVLFGMGSNPFSEGSAKVATVNGEAITQAEWDFAHQQQVDQARNANPNLDLSLFDTPLMKQRTLDSLVRDRVLAAAAQDEHLHVSDARLAEVLAQDPSIASLRDADGRLDVEGYQRLLALQGLTPEGFEARVRANLSVQQVLTGVADSELFDRAQVNASMAAFLERRQVRVQMYEPQKFAQDITPSEADLQSYYQAHLANYQVPESVDIEYLVLDLEGVKKNVTVSEEDLHTYYEQNAASFGQAELRGARHILIAAPSDAPAAEREQAKAKATDLLAQLREDPDRFEALAKEFSDDDVSAPNGGDLGTFAQGQGIDPVISEETYKLDAEGDVSEVVETEFGYHLIQLSELKPAQVPAFDDLRAELEDQLRTQLAQAEFSELGERFSNGVYEQSDSLQPVADSLRLEIQRADGVTRDVAPGASGVLATPKFLSALFGSDALNHQRNTEAVTAEGGQLVSGRVVKHTPAHARTLDEVMDTVRTAYLAEKGAEAARQAGVAELKAWQAKPDSASAMPEAVEMSRQEPQGHSSAVLEAVMRVDPSKLPQFVGVDLGSQGYAIAQVEKVLDEAAPSDEEQAQMQASYAQLWQAAEIGSYYDFLKARYKVKVLVAAP